MISESTVTLRELEISLRTNHVGWTKEFINEENNGLSLLSEYLSFALYAIVFSNLAEHIKPGQTTEAKPNQKQLSQKQKEHDRYKKIVMGHDGNFSDNDTEDELEVASTRNLIKFESKIDQAVQSFDDIRRSHSLPAKRILKNSKILCDKDDIHVCIMCVRSIMNYQLGFKAVVAHPTLVNQCTLAFNHPSQRTKSIVLDLLAAVALVHGGHNEVLKAFDHFKHVCGEEKRFEWLMNTFNESSGSSVELQVACMQFINILVHSVEDMNYRVHLQWEFTLLGLDKRIKTLQHTRMDNLQVQVQAYIDNMFNVATLIEDSEARIVAESKTNALENKLEEEQERRVEQEYDAMSKIVELEKQLSQAQSQLDKIRGVGKGVYSLPGVHHAGKPGEGMGGQLEDVGDGFGMSGIPGEGLAPPGLPPLPEAKLPGGLKPPGMPDDDDDDDNGLKIKTRDANEGLKKIKDKIDADQEKSEKEKPEAPDLPDISLPGGDVPPPPGMDIPLPPAPPGMGGDIPLPPNLLGGPGKGPGGLKAKKRHQTKYRMPVLNWQALKPSQISGTIFNELDDDKVLSEIDMTTFEEIFKTRAQDSEADAERMKKLKEKASRGTSLIDTSRARNLAITLRKIALSTDEICRAVYSYDLNELPLEYVEMLPKFIPNDNELKAFRQYEKQEKPFDALSAEDKFMWLFGRVERLQQRLNIMIFIGNFKETVTILNPQLAAVISASLSIKSSQKLKKILELVLAFGNYMNSAKRGSVYGFKLASLESLTDTKSTDKKQNLLHYIVSVVNSYYPDIADFYSEVRYISESAKVSLENVYNDVAEINKGKEMTMKEYETHQHPVLKDFLEQADQKINKIKEDADAAQKAYKNARFLTNNYKKIRDFFLKFRKIVRWLNILEKR